MLLSTNDNDSLPSMPDWYCIGGYIRLKVQRPFALQILDDNEKIIGSMTIRDGKLFFEGEADESALIFFECISKYFEKEFERWQ